ncbi:DUF2255 family protein [Chloroflexia bacterium SDU3-3]|nr:DUF2255 family protein [Chloroflexia bacterium SDU3-3]
MGSQWTLDDLQQIGAAVEIEIAGERGDGTLRKPVIIWVVRAKDGLYVRSYKGEGAAWFRGAKVRHQGKIWAGGQQHAATFVEVSDPQINDLVDEAYRGKYRRYGPQYIDAMTTPAVRATTLQIMPRS